MTRFLTAIFLLIFLISFSQNNSNPYLDKKLINNANLDADIFVMSNDKSIKLGKNNRLEVINSNEIE